MVGLADEMIRTQVTPFGEQFPAMGFTNNDDYKKIQPADALPILYSIKANGILNTQIHTNTYTRLTGGMVRFLIPEQDARTKLLATEKGKHMSTQQRIERLMPHEMTTKLFEEMANLRLKRNGMDVAVEQINTRFPKDKYSAFSYGLWRIKELEEEDYKRKRHKSAYGGRQLVFYTAGDQ